MRFRVKPQARLLTVSVLNLKTLGWDRVLPELNEVVLVEALQAYNPAAPGAERGPAAAAAVPAGEPGRLLTVMQTAARLGVDRTTVWRMFRRGALRPVRIGRKTVRVSEAELVRLAASGGEAAAESAGPGAVLHGQAGAGEGGQAG